jgi:hypothetical protein
MVTSTGPSRTKNYLYGRRMYEVMAVWQTMATHDPPSFIADFANVAGRRQGGLSYSQTPKSAFTPGTHIESISSARRFSG